MHLPLKELPMERKTPRVEKEERDERSEGEGEEKGEEKEEKEEDGQSEGEDERSEGEDSDEELKKFPRRNPSPRFSRPRVTHKIFTSQKLDDLIEESRLVLLPLITKRDVTAVRPAANDHDLLIQDSFFQNYQRFRQNFVMLPK
jgi:hypothetical protein